MDSKKKKKLKKKSEIKRKEWKCLKEEKQISVLFTQNFD